MDHPDSFGARLRAARIAAGHTQEELARLIDVTTRAVGKLESGESKGPSARTLQRLSAVLGVSIDALLSFSAENEGEQPPTCAGS